MNEINPYNLSTFGKVSAEYESLKQVFNNPHATADDMRQHWATFQPLMAKLLCHASEGSNEAPDFISPDYTGMPSSQELALPECVHTTWERMRVLQGLFMHMQMWLFFAAHQVASEPRPFCAEYYNETLRDLINQLADLLECCDSLPDSTQGWAVQVIEQCIEEAKEHKHHSSL